MRNGVIKILSVDLEQESFSCMCDFLGQLLDEEYRSRVLSFEDFTYKKVDQNRTVIIASIYFNE